MKVLQINAVYGISSTGRTTMELDQYLQSHGVESIVAATMTNTPREGLFLIGSRFDRYLHGFLSRLTGLQGHFSSRATRKLIDFIRKEEPDIVHLRNLHGNYIHFPMLMHDLIEAKLPVVITLHDCWFFKGKCCHYTEDRCNKWKDHCGKCPALRKWNNSWFFDCSTKMLREKQRLFSELHKLAVIGVSDWITNEARASILKDSTIIRRIYNWINLEVFYPRDSSALRRRLGVEGKFVVLGVAQVWSERKGLDTFSQMASKRNDLAVVLVGEVPPKIALPDNLIRVGATSSVRELAEYYSMADVLLNPSIQETFGKTTAEAIACGTPVIGFNVTAMPELIGKDCGEILEADCRIEEILAALERIKVSGRKRYLSKCVAFAKENFDKEKLMGDYLALYRELVG